MRASITTVAVLTLVAGSPAQALDCLDQQTLTAARVNEFAILMTAVKLRCKTVGIDLSASYDAMMTNHRPFFSAADRKLRAFFADKPRAFDAYTTRLGNRFGGGATDYATCNRFDKVARDLAENSDAGALGRVVFKMVAVPHIEGTDCPRP